MTTAPKQFHIRVCNTGQEVAVAGHRDLLSELGLTTARGAVVEGCRGGGCGICRVRIVSGRYSCGRMSKAEVTDAERAEGFALACKVIAETDLEIEAVGKRFFCKSRYPDPGREVSGRSQPGCKGSKTETETT